MKHKETERLNTQQQGMNNILLGLKKDLKVGKAVDRIIEEATELDEMQSKLILLVKKYFENLSKSDVNIGEKTRFNDEEVAGAITKFTRELIRGQEKQEPDVDISRTDSDKYPLSKKAKIATKKAIKEFMVYEIYKVMNPRRIAGETTKDNYEHNMMLGGAERAAKYDGGRESDLRSYGKAEVRRIERASKSFQNKGGGFSI